MHNRLLFAAMGSLLSACTLWHREPQSYTDAITELLDTDERNDKLVACYEAALDRDRTLSGLVVVDYVVAKKTGEVGQVAVDPSKTKAPAPLQACALAHFQGLRLHPPDLAQGHGSLAIRFKPGRPRPAATATSDTTQIAVPAVEASAPTRSSAVPTAAPSSSAPIAPVAPSSSEVSAPVPSQSTAPSQPTASPPMATPPTSPPTQPTRASPSMAPTPHQPTATPPTPAPSQPNSTTTSPR